MATSIRGAVDVAHTGKNRRCPVALPMSTDSVHCRDSGRLWPTTSTLPCGDGLDGHSSPDGPGPHLGDIAAQRMDRGGIRQRSATVGSPSPRCMPRWSAVMKRSFPERGVTPIDWRKLADLRCRLSGSQRWSGCPGRRGLRRRVRRCDDASLGGRNGLPGW